MKPQGKKLQKHFFPSVTLNGLSKRGNKLGLTVIMYFVKRKQFVGQRHFESLSLLCFMNQLRGEQKLRKKKKNNINKLHKRNKTTNASKIDAISAQNVWEFIFMLDFSIFTTTKGNFPYKVY